MSGELIFRDRSGASYQPVRHFNRSTGHSAFRVKPAGASNRTEDCLEVETIEDLAKAMLVDGLPARVKPLSGGPVNYLRFGGEKLVTYDLDETIAARLGIPARSGESVLHRRSSALDRLRQRFLEAYPDFEEFGGFPAVAGSYHKRFRSKVDALLSTVSRHRNDPEAVLNDLLLASRQQSRGASPPFFDGDVVWRTPKAREVDPVAFDAAVLALLEATDDPPLAVERFNAEYWPLLQASADGRPRRDTRVVPSTLLALVAPDRAISVRYQSYSNASKLLNARFLFADKPMTAAEYREVLALAEQIRSALIGWGWEPRDLWDVHGFVMATCSDRDLDGNASDQILAHFDSNPAFRQARTRWSRSDMEAFVSFAQAIHETGLDWYFVNIPPYELRFGQKQPGRDAREVVGYVSGSPPKMALRHRAPVALKTIGDEFVPVDDALLTWVAEQHALLSSRSDPDRDLGLWPDQYGAEQHDADIEDPEDHAPMTTNLILYGPPGTGKTFATARVAVELCGEQPPEDRDALMERYRALSEAGRIEFVTFHQSMAYEDFVEGLRPSSTDEDGQPLAGGFRLVPTPGIFRRIARRAETSTGSGGADFSIGGRQVFKMSIGDATNPEDAYLFEEAIEGGHITLGFSDIDWSDPKYGDRNEIMSACQAVASPGKELNAQSAVVQMPHIFRNWMREGDVVIVSKGTKLFRAIGVITGPYRFAPREGGDYGHRRNVEWLWVDREGVPVEEIYSRGFSMRTTYAMFRNDLNIPALERYANSQQQKNPGGAEPFVLVIDEINRANISKVFGELITLLEPDKRLGGTNALKARLPYSGDLFGVPPNLHIVGTMNTADRSIALIDKALRRRFRFEEVMPDYTIEGMNVDVGGAGVTLAEVLRTLNDRIEYLLDREHQIGHGWLLGCTTKPRLDDAMREKVIPLIAEYFFEDWGRTADVLGGRENNPFLETVKLSPPPGMSGDEPRYRWLPRREFDSDAYLRLVGRG